VEIGSNAFIATGTNTVILFMKRRDDKFVKDREKIAKEVFSGQYFTDERVKRDYIDALKLLNKFLEFRELPKDDYLKFVKDGVLTNKLLNTEMFEDYKKHFEGKVKKDKEIKKLRGKRREERIKEKFLEYLKEKEEEKFFYFLLTFLDGEKPNDEKFYTFQMVFVVRAPEKTEEQKRFLGYEFSKRRGYEGIVIHKDENGKMTSRLYDPENYDNPTKISAYIRKSFDDDYLEVSEEIKPYGRWAYLAELIDWNKVDFDKAINLEGYKKSLIESKHPLVKLGNEFGVKSGQNAPQEKKYFINGKYPFIRAKDLNATDIDGTLNLKILERVNEDAIKDLGLKIFKAPALLFPKSGQSINTGNIAIIKNSESEKNFCAVNHLAVILPKEYDGNELIKLKYLFLMFKYFLDFRRLKTGKKDYPSIRLSDIENCKIPFPPLDIQREIVEEIGKVEKEQRDKEKKIEELKQEIRKTIEEIKKQDWNEVRLGDILSLEYGKGLPKSKRRAGKYLVVGSNGIDGYHDEYLVEAPCVVIGRKGSAGKVNIYFENCWPIDTTYYVKTNQNIRFIYYVLKSLEPELEKLSKGIGVPGLNREDVYNLKLPLPPLDVQKKIVEEIEKVEKEIEQLEKEIKDAESRKKEILEKYLK